jgi:hypothetical protein
MKNLKSILCISLMTFSIIFFGYISNSVMAVSPDLLNQTHIFGPLAGVATNDTVNVDWVLTGNWRSTLTNDTVTSANNVPMLNNQTSGAFRAAIEMIKPDGTDRHTHTLTNFVVLNSTQGSENSSTTFRGTSTISLMEGPVVDIPTTIERSGNGNVFVITLDPESVDYHFGESPLIYGISANPEFTRSPPPFQ